MTKNRTNKICKLVFKEYSNELKKDNNITIMYIIHNCILLGIAIDMYITVNNEKSKMIVLISIILFSILTVVLLYALYFNIKLKRKIKNYINNREFSIIETDNQYSIKINKLDINFPFVRVYNHIDI